MMQQIPLSCIFFTITLSCVFGSALHSGNNLKPPQEFSNKMFRDILSGPTEMIGTPVDIKVVKFFLHTSQDKVYPNRTIDPVEIAQTSGKIYFLIHGWTQSRQNTSWYRPLTKLLLRTQADVQVVQVDWSEPAHYNYPSSVSSTESVGNIIGDFIIKLVTENNERNIVLIGHSLGAHVAGWAGKRYQTLTDMKLSRIIGLDPAGPLFSTKPEEERLNKNDAEVVMVIHSDAGILGIADPSGTIDFFPNGGSGQPGCYQVLSKKLPETVSEIFCNHQRCYKLFVEAVRDPSHFLAKRCDTYEDFLENKCDNVEASLGDLETIETGFFYLQTSGKEQFTN